MNKYLEKIAVVRRSVKQMRRALQLAAEGTHDFHTTYTSNLPKILRSGELKVGRGGHDAHGKGVYFGHKKPAEGAEPFWRTGGVALPISPNRELKKIEHSGEIYAISKSNVPLRSGSGKSYVFMPKTEAGTRAGKGVLELARKNKIRVLENEHVNTAFSKLHKGYDPWGLTTQPRPKRSQIINMMKAEDRAAAKIKSSTGIEIKNPWRSSSYAKVD